MRQIFLYFLFKNIFNSKIKIPTTHLCFLLACLERYSPYDLSFKAFNVD